MQEEQYKVLFSLHLCCIINYIQYKYNKERVIICIKIKKYFLFRKYAFQYF